MAQLTDQKPDSRTVRLARLPWKPILRALIIVVSAGWIYGPVLGGDWLWDDDRYITDNPLLAHLSGLAKIWFEPGDFIDYYPVTESVEWVQWHLWGTDTFGYHLTNLVLHILGALLVWRLLSKFGLRLAWLGGLLFAVHPVQVESVAWISELKNTLSLPPFLLAMIFYLDYEEKKRPRDYGLALGFFLVAMLCKITMAPFPLVILLHAWWKRGRIGWDDLKASAPFFTVSLVLGTMMLGLGAAFNHVHTLQDTVGASFGAMPQGGWLSRIALAGLSLAFYFFNCVWPVGLLPIYPKWPIDPPSPLQFLPWPVMIGAIYWLWTKRRDWGRHALLGVGFFLAMLAPFATVHWEFTWVMDHFLYLPIIGLIGLAGAGLGQMEERLSVPVRSAAIGITASLLALLAWESHAYAEKFINEETLWSYTLQRNPGAWLAHNNLGYALFIRGQVDAAMLEYQTALEIDPNYADAHNNLGYALSKKGRLNEAEAQYQKALELDPNSANARNNLGDALLKTGKTNEAMTQFQQALGINPNHAKAQNNLGYALLKMGEVDEAAAQYQKALKIDPNYADAHYNLGLVLLQTGQTDEAMAQFQKALELDPANAGAHNNLGTISFARNQMDEAIGQFQKALELDPNDVRAHNNLGSALFKSGRVDEAIIEYQKAIEISPDYADAHRNLGIVLLQKGEVREAVVQDQEVVRLHPADPIAQKNLAHAQAMARQAAGSK